MTPDMSFGPVSSLLLVFLFLFLVLISYVNTKKEIIQKLVTEKDERKKKKLTYGPNNTSGIIWAHFIVTACFSIDISYVKPKI